MIRSAFLRRMVTLTICAVVLTAMFTSSIFYLVAQNLFLNMSADQLLPSAQNIAELTVAARTGGLPFSLYKSIISSDNNLWDARIHIYDENRALLLYSIPTENPDEEQFVEADSYLAMHAPLMDRVYAGEAVRSGQFYSSLGYLVVGAPVVQDDQIVGAVLLTKPMRELAGMSSNLYSVLVGSALMALICMLFPIYYFFRRSVEPINQMRNIAMRMASGDFHSRASTDHGGEVGDLGKALNHLASQLDRNITDLQVERNRLRSIVNGIDEALVAVDAEGHVTHVNPMVDDLFRCPTEDCAHDELLDRLQLREVFAQALTESNQLDYHSERSDHVIQGSLTPLHDESGKAVGAVGLFRDVTEEERLERMQREYVANVSHELRTPISSLRSLAETLNDGLLQSEADKKRYYGYILRESMRLSRLVDDLLELSRLQAGNVALLRREVNIASLVQELGERYASVPEDVGINFHVEDCSACPSAMTNADRIEQILVILLDNAVKFTPIDGEIHISANWDNEFVYLTVADSGVGISETDQKHIFERFYKVDKAHSGQGTGLGLSIAHEIITRLGGHIWVRSHPGKGTAFTFSMPRTETSGSATSSKEEE